MRLLILGGGSGQLGLIKKAKELGHQVVVSDYLADAPGKKIADFSSLSSTFDYEANLKTAKKYDVDAVLTAGTDQPVYTAAKLAEKLNLIQYLKSSTAAAVTNKKIMKKKFSETGIATVKYKILSADFNDDQLSDFKRPFVVKPLDSQGQRGVFKLDSTAELREKFKEVLSYSRENEILIEEYYPSAEITVSAWVKDNKAKILTVTDRLCFQKDIHIGICSSHLFPSRYLEKHHSEIKALTEKIVNEFKIENGPIYFQFLIGSEGIKVNEIACRIGGAYEGVSIPALTGVDILKMMVNLAADNKIDYKKFDNYELKENNKHLSAQLFFAAPAEIAEITAVEKIKRLPGVLACGFNYKLGEKINKIENAAARAGHFIVLAENKSQLRARVARVYDNLEIKNKKGKNLIFRSRGENF